MTYNSNVINGEKIKDLNGGDQNKTSKVSPDKNVIIKK